jgi:hypothetical protein
LAQVFLVTGLNRKFGISDEWFAIGDSLILTVLGQVTYVCQIFYDSSDIVEIFSSVTPACGMLEDQLFMSGNFLVPAG